MSPMQLDPDEEHMMVAEEQHRRGIAGLATDLETVRAQLALLTRAGTAMAPGLEIHGPDGRLMGSMPRGGGGPGQHLGERGDFLKAETALMKHGLTGKAAYEAKNGAGTFEAKRAQLEAKASKEAAYNKKYGFDRAIAQKQEELAGKIAGLRAAVASAKTPAARKAAMKNLAQARTALAIATRHTGRMQGATNAAVKARTGAAAKKQAAAAAAAYAAIYDKQQHSSNYYRVATADIQREAAGLAAHVQALQLPLATLTRGGGATMDAAYVIRDDKGHYMGSLPHGGEKSVAAEKALSDHMKTNAAKYDAQHGAGAHAAKAAELTATADRHAKSMDDATIQGMAAHAHLLKSATDFKSYQLANASPADAKRIRAEMASMKQARQHINTALSRTKGTKGIRQSAQQAKSQAKMDAKNAAFAVKQSRAFKMAYQAASRKGMSHNAAFAAAAATHGSGLTASEMNAALGRAQSPVIQRLGMLSAQIEREAEGMSEAYVIRNAKGQIVGSLSRGGGHDAIGKAHEELYAAHQKALAEIAALKAGGAKAKSTSSGSKKARPSATDLGYKPLIDMTHVRIDPYATINPHQYAQIYGKEQLPKFLADQALHKLQKSAQGLMQEHPGTKPSKMSSKASIIAYITQHAGAAVAPGGQQVFSQDVHQRSILTLDRIQAQLAALQRRIITARER